MVCFYLKKQKQPQTTNIWRKEWERKTKWLSLVKMAGRYLSRQGASLFISNVINVWSFDGKKMKSRGKFYEVKKEKKKLERERERERARERERERERERDLERVERWVEKRIERERWNRKT